MNYQAFVFLIAVGGLCLFTGLYRAVVLQQSTLGGTSVPSDALTIVGIAIITLVLWRKKKL
jgi:hypothetical protein